MGIIFSKDRRDIDVTSGEDVTEELVLTDDEREARIEALANEIRTKITENGVLMHLLRRGAGRLRARLRQDGLKIDDLVEALRRASNKMISVVEEIVRNVS